jgi:hypothetical protein
MVAQPTTRGQAGIGHFRIIQAAKRMASADRLLGMYLHLARASRMRRQPLVRAKLLILAGVQAQEMGLDPIADLCRHRVLAHNPRHLVRRWPTLAEALRAEAFQSHVKQLRRRYSSEKVEHMLASLGIEMGRERAAYFSDTEYAAALLDTRPDAIDEVLSQPLGKPAAISDAAELARAPVGPPAGRSRTTRERLAVWLPFLGGLLILAAVAALAQSGP